MKQCDKPNSHISSKLHMIYISSDNGRHPVTKTFTKLHYTSLHLSILHFFPLNFTQLHFTTLSFGLYEEVCTFMIIYRWILLRMRIVSDRYTGCTPCIEKIRTHISPSVLIFRKSCLLRDNVENTWLNLIDHRWRYSTAHAHCMLD